MYFILYFLSFMAIVNLVFLVSISIFLIRTAEAIFKIQDALEYSKKPAIKQLEDTVEKLESESALVDMPMPNVRPYA